MSVGERHRRRPVPRLHQRRVVLVKRASIGRHRRVRFPRFGNEHRHRVRQRPAGERQHLQHVVDRRRVTLVGAADWEERLGAIPESGGSHRRFAHAHPIQISAQGVDLAVVAEEAVRMRQPPRRKGVGRETRMHQRNCASQIRVPQIAIKSRQLVGRQHSLVDNRARRERREIAILPFRDRAQRCFYFPPDDVERDLE